MLISHNWLAEYVDLKMPLDELTDRLTMSGLNLEGTETVGDDQAIDLEVTSNRADCLGHVGVAREVAALYNSKLKIPDPQPPTISDSVDKHVSVSIENPRHCFRYTARLIRGVKIGPSPQWLQDRLTTIGIGIVNNVVDATNYVMFECGQPLHAFDFSKISAGKIVVRQALPKEKLVAIDHHEYHLSAEMGVICDSRLPLALGGVMGGADSEVNNDTVDVLLEAAHFDPLSVRNTARSLNLHSPSSFRFERNIDSANIDWASRRCCELILASAGGELLDGMIDVGEEPTVGKPVTLRFNQLQRILGTEVPADVAVATLKALGLSIEKSDAESVTAIAPSWRKDLTREVDLIEEVGRIYGYDKVPDDAPVPMAASHRPAADRVLDRIRHVLTAAGFDECVTASLVPQPWSEAFSPWTDLPPLQSSQPMLGVLEKSSQNIGAVDLLRRSLVPSLIEVRRINQDRSNDEAELFETSKVYLPLLRNEIPDQPTKVAIASGRPYSDIKGIVETLVSFIAPQSSLVLKTDAETTPNLLDISRSGELLLSIGGKETLLGWLGEISASAKKQFGLRTDTTVCEIDLGVLAATAVLIVQHENQSVFPPVTRDFNFIVENAIHWSDLETTVRSAAGSLLENVIYRETFRDEKKDGPDKKRLLLSVVLRSSDETLTGDQADEVSQRIIDRCQSQHAAALSS